MAERENQSLQERMQPDTDGLVSGCAQLGIRLSQEQVDLFIRYYRMLVEKNRVMNLTAITDWDEVVTKHFVDSLSLVKGLDAATTDTVMDLGTGAGFPGIPLKIAFPHLRITLADSLGKRVRFLNEVIEACGLTQIRAVHGRAEDLAREKAYREAYDLCVSRAVANLSTLSEYCLPFVRVGGSFAAYKSGNTGQEIGEAKRALHLLGGKLSGEPVSFLLPQTDISRTLVVIRKERKTPMTYPRKAGTPSREPLR